MLQKQKREELESVAKLKYFLISRLDFSKHLKLVI